MDEPDGETALMPVDPETDSTSDSTSSSDSAASSSDPGSTTDTTSSGDEETTAAPPPEPLVCSPTALLCEDFEYPVGDLPYGPLWNPDEAIDGNIMEVVAPGLEFASHPGSAIGNTLTLSEQQKEAPRSNFAKFVSGRMFIGFTININDNGPALWRRIIGFAHGTNGARCGTLVVQSSRTDGGSGGLLALGLDISHNITVDVASDYVLFPWTTYTVVYEKDMSAKKMRIYVIQPQNPIPDAPPAPLLESSYGCENATSGVAIGNRGFTSFGQYPADLADGLQTRIDGIRVATSWQGLWATE